MGKPAGFLVVLSNRCSAQHKLLEQIMKTSKMFHQLLLVVAKLVRVKVFGAELTALEGTAQRNGVLRKHVRVLVLNVVLG